MLNIFYKEKKVYVNPYPIVKTDLLISPMKISQNYSVFVSPMKPSYYQMNTTDQQLTPFLSKNSGIRFNLTSEKSPMV